MSQKRPAGPAMEALANLWQATDQPAAIKPVRIFREPAAGCRCPKIDTRHAQRIEIRLASHRSRFLLHQRKPGAY